jgi:DNA-binding NarL/FixJ family response regulator
MTLTEPDPISTPSTRNVRVLCGIPALAAELGMGLKPFGWHIQPDADITLIIDGPWGIALQFLLQQAADHKPGSKAIVLSDNPCPEYWEDLWDFGLCALLVNGHNLPDIIKALERAQKGETFRQIPGHESPLSRGERKLLCGAAMSLENQEIANQQNLKLGTVKNGLTRVFEKLGLKNRVQATLYYWGLWHLLEPHPLRSGQV